jgi:hypothetical protein
MLVIQAIVKSANISGAKPRDSECGVFDHFCGRFDPKTADSGHEKIGTVLAN